MRRVVTSWELIRSILKEHAPESYKALRPPATTTAIHKLEQLIGKKLPNSLVSFLLIHDGMSTSGGVTFFDYITLLSAARMAEWWRIEMENPWDDPGPRFDHGRKMKGDLRWRSRWLPIADDAGGNLLGIDLDPGPAGHSGQVFSWRNNGAPPPRVLARSFAAWLDTIAEEMSRGGFEVDEFGGIQLRKRLS